MNEIVNPYEELSQIIQCIEKELINYKKGTNVVEYVVKKRMELIIQLNKVLDLIVMYDTNAVITTIAYSIDEIKKKDSELDSLLIRIDYVLNGQKTGFIKIKAYK